MFRKLLETSGRSVLWIVLLHLCLGLICLLSNVFIFIWFYSLLFSAIVVAFGSAKSPRIHLFILVYFSSFDVLGRMLKCSPVIPYELSKYFILVYSLFAFLQIGRVSYVFVFSVSVTVIAILTTFFYGFDLQGFVNYGLGITNLLILICLFKGKMIRLSDLFVVLRLLMYACLPILAYTLIRTPSYSKIEFGLSANFAASGGFGSNQVSAMLGLGALVVLIFILLEKRLTGFKLLDVSLFGGFVFQGFLTFSRGGAFGMALSLFLLYMILLFGNSGGNYRRMSKYRITFYTVIGVTSFLLVFFLVNFITKDQLMLRYLGETNATIGGYKQKNLEVITSNRSLLFIEDLEVWAEHPIFGVGFGNSEHFREKTMGIAAHVEMSRLLAEQGLFGLMIFCYWVSLFFTIGKANRDTVTIGVLSVFFTLALFTSLHSSLRTQITPILTAVSILRVRRN